MGRKPPRPGARVAALLLAGLLGACETAGGDSTAPESGTASQTETGAGDQAAPEVAALPPEPEIDDDPERLLGLGPEALSDLLGRPELIRRESPAQVWQYRGADCVLDVVLYREVGGESVTYVEARDGDGDRTEPRPCLNQLLRARLAAGPG